MRAKETRSGAVTALLVIAMGRMLLSPGRPVEGVGVAACTRLPVQANRRRLTATHLELELSKKLNFPRSWNYDTSGKTQKDALMTTIWIGLSMRPPSGNCKKERTKKDKCPLCLC